MEWARQGAAGIHPSLRLGPSRAFIVEGVEVEAGGECASGGVTSGGDRCMHACAQPRTRTGGARMGGCMDCMGVGTRSLGVSSPLWGSRR